MPGQPTPPLVVEAFGINANPAYITNPIPLTTVTPGAASFDQGFPALTMTPVIAGGIPPLGQDVNGILYMVSAHIAALQAGQAYTYSATLEAAMGGYALGAVLAMADGTGLWINQTAGNTTNPDTGGADWLPLYHYGFAAMSGLVGGVRTATALEARCGVLVMTGALVGNQQIVLPNTLQRWLVVNATTGAFVLTVKTAAGTGVAVPQSGYAAPVEVYGDGTNIYPVVAPAIGSGAQVWADLSGSRALGTSYTNSTVNPIQVCFTPVLGAPGTIAAVVGGVTIGRLGASNSQIEPSISFIVPPGVSYQVNLVGGSVVSFRWAELR